VSGEGRVRIALPPKVSEAIARQRDALTNGELGDLLAGRAARHRRRGIVIDCNLPPRDRKHPHGWPFQPWTKDDLDAYKGWTSELKNYREGSDPVFDGASYSKRYELLSRHLVLRVYNPLKRMRLAQEYFAKRETRSRARLSPRW
jgi:hypothetical protein